MSETAPDPHDGLTGEARNYAVLKRRGDLPRHVQSYGDYLAWKKIRSEGVPEPQPPSGSGRNSWLLLFLTYGTVLTVSGYVAWFGYTRGSWFLWSLGTGGAFITSLMVAGLMLYDHFRPGNKAARVYDRYAKKWKRLGKGTIHPNTNKFWEATVDPLINKLKTFNVELPDVPSMEVCAKQLFLNVVNTTLFLPNFDATKLAVYERYNWWFDNPRAVVENIRNVVLEVLTSFVRALPKDYRREEGIPIGSSPVTSLVDVRRLVPILIGHFFGEEANRFRLFEETRYQLNLNRYVYSEEEGKRIEPEQFRGSSEELAKTYLNNTPLLSLFEERLTFRLPEKLRFEHMHIIASQGHGKTQTLQAMLNEDLKSDVSLIVIDPHGDMFEKLARLDTKRRITIIDPKDMPALNPFDISGVGLDKLKSTDRTQALTSIISLYEYFFGALLGAELTAKQGVLFRYLAHLMISIPNANLNTLIAVMDDATPFAHVIDGLPPNARTFLFNEFMKGRTFNDTKEQVKYRLYDLIENPAFDAMFNAPTNTLNLAHEMNTGGIVLIHADAGFLEQKRASIFGRFFIAKALQAAIQRIGQREDKRHPTYLYIDEAWMFFDTKIDQLLDQARKFKLGLILAHQRLSQASEALQSSLNTTALKLAGNVSSEDAVVLARNMHTEPEEIQRLVSTRTYAEWLLYARGRASAIKLQTPFNTLEERPALSWEAYSERREANRKRLSSAPPRVEQKSPAGQDY